MKKIGDSIEIWAQGLISDYKVVTGQPLSVAWQHLNKSLDPGMRLLPKLPFVLGDKYIPENLYAIRDTDGMLFRASLSRQIREMPDGSPIELRVEVGRLRE